MNFTLDTQQEVCIKNIEQDGYVVVNNLLSQDQCLEYKRKLNALYDALHPFYASVRQKSSHALDSKDEEKVVFNLHNKHIAFMQLINHPFTTPILAHLLQQGSYNNAEPFIYTGSSGRSPKFNSEQQLHIDSRVPGCGLTLQAQCLWILDDFTQTNGATRLVPKSHKYQGYPENGKRYPDEITVSADAGSVIIFNGGLWHGSGKKSTKDDRWGIIVSYARWFYKQTFKMLHNTPRPIFNQLSDFEKTLLGGTTDTALDEFQRISMRSEKVTPPETFYSNLAAYDYPDF